MFQYKFFITDPTKICLQSKPASPWYKVGDCPPEPCNSCVVMYTVFDQITWYHTSEYRIL